MNNKESPELEALFAKARALVDVMTPLERAQMLREQAESWVRAEEQWAKDFREGKCERG